MALMASEVILKNLIKNSEFTARVLPFLKDEYFERREEKILFSQISKHVEKFQSNPTIESLYISLIDEKTINEREAEGVDDIIKTIRDNNEESKMDWLIETTERFCQERALHNAITSSIQIMGGEKKGVTTGAIPDLLKEALAISFDSSLGHDFIADAEKRYEYYHRPEIKIPFDLEFLNKITKGGFTKKTLSVFMAGTHVGKSAFMCHQAGFNMKDGKNVLYFTMEMAEEEISKRIDANLLDLTIDDVMVMPKDLYMKKINKLKAKTLGKLIVKEYPMGGANVGHFRMFINELRLKQNFIPDIIYIDYLNICSSLRMAGNKQASSYSLVKSISEEVRGLATETNTAIVSATQTNRSGFDNSDPDMTDISESFALNFGVDFMAAMIATDDLKSRNQILIKQLKNRFSDMNKYPKFLIGFDREKMKYFDVDDPTGGLSGAGSNNPPPQDIPVMDSGQMDSKGWDKFSF